MMERDKQIEKALQEAEEKYRHIFENAMEGIYQAGTDGRFMSANPALARLHGYSSPAELMEAVGSIRDDLFSDPARHKEMIRRLLAHNAVSGFEARMRRKDGSEHWVSMNIRVFRDGNGRILFYEGTMVNITERKEAEHALAESEERYRTVIEHSNDGIAIVLGGRHVYVNSRFVKMFGYDSPDQIVNKAITLIVHPDDRERVMEMNARREKGQPVPPRYEFKGLTRSGGTIYIEVSATEVTYRDRPEVLIFLRDVTERKRAEEVFLQSHRQLEQLNRAKTKAVDHISHELKTPLAVIQGNVRVLRRRLEQAVGEDTYKEMLKAIERNLERLFHMERDTDEILMTSRELEAVSLPDELDRLKERLADLGEVSPEIDACVQGLKKWVVSRMPRGTGAFQPVELYIFLVQAGERARHLAAHRHIDVRVEGLYGIYILMDPAILRDVIDGLVRNGIENTPDGGCVTISLEERGEQVLVHVTDSGVGISEENQQYIFDGLFHTKDTELYASLLPYEFGAGGKGLDLLRMKVYGERFGFALSMKSTRCRHLPGDRDVCPGDISDCPHCKTAADCDESGGTTFTVTFMKGHDKDIPSPSPL
jgi:PAS domain S-box-containing protein